MIARIAVSSAVFSIDKPYDYRVPEDMSLSAGMRVRVPFGRGNRPCEGMVLALSEGDAAGLKSVTCPLDAAPLLDDRLLRLTSFLRERYFCTFYEALKAVLPAGVWFQQTERYEIAAPDWQSAIHRQPVALAVMQSITALGGAADASALRAQFEEEPLQRALQYLLHKHLLCCQTSSRRRVRDKTERIACLCITPEEALRCAAAKRKSAPVQAAALELLAATGECAVKDLAYFTGVTAATLRRLEQLGCLCLREQEALRLPPQRAVAPAAPLTLNSEQEEAYRGLRQQMQREKPGVALLHGVTGSGKTAVYLRLIADCLAQQKSAVVLVPEIALTPQLMTRFTAHFGERVAVLHSGLRITQRYDTWKQIRAGETTVVLGTRSAVFAPVPNAGLFIVDEEQEHTYQSENSPRYHAAEVAIYRGVQTGALVLLGSATPRVESMYRARTGVYQLYTLRSRYNQQALPPVELVDMKRELRAGNATAISAPLLHALRENLRSGQQSILFLNRRGSSRMTQCVDCGHVPGCPACTVSLTYHQDNRRLMCHYCGHTEPLPARCPVCGGHLKQVGVGTQRVQEQLAQLLPDCAVLRMDADTVSAVNTHEKLLDHFRQERVPVLLGTQMVAKGLDFENVTLVGVLDADMSLYTPGYRAVETTFHLITQVIGRAGRGEKQGRALIQTMTPENPVIRLAAQQDYDRFYESELPLRVLRGCPPYRDLITLTIHGREEQGVWNVAQEFRAVLEAQLASPFYAGEEVQLLGPAPAQIPRVNYQFRCRLTLSCRNTRTLRALLAHLMRQFLREKRGIGIYADLNSNE